MLINRSQSYTLKTSKSRSALSLNSSSQLNNCSFKKDSLLSVKNKNFRDNQKHDFLIKNTRKITVPAKAVHIKIRKITLPEKILKKRKSLAQTASTNPVFHESSVVPKILSNKNDRFLIAYTSRKGTKNRTNQDRLIVIPEFQSRPELAFFCVLDGHGEEGHHISDYLKTAFFELIQKKFNSSFILSPNQIHSLLSDSLKELITSLKSTPFNISFSGCSLLALFFCKDLLFSINIGNSKSIICSFSRKWSSNTLNIIHTASEVSEQSRVLRKGGSVGQSLNEFGVPFGPMKILTADCADGTVLTRSIGDSYYKDYGLIDLPDIFKFNLKLTDKFIVMGSQGLWNALEESEVIETVKKYLDSPDPQQGISEIINLINEKRTDNGLEDISIIIIYLS